MTGNENLVSAEALPAAAQPDLAAAMSAHLPAWMGAEIIGIALWQLISAFLFIFLGMLLKKIVERIIETRLIPLFRKTRVSFDHLFLSALSRPLGFLLLLAGIAGALAFLPLPAEPLDIRSFASGVLKLLFAADALWFLFRLIDTFVQYLSELSARTESKLDSQMVPLIRNALKTTVGIMTFLWVIQLFGYSVSSLLAGLGIGGLAVALGMQDTLSNFFGSIFIFLDRPFVVGDWIRMGEVEGVVEDVGFRSTRIRTFPKTLVVVPNKTVSNATIDNQTRMPRRRVLQQIGVTYETSADQMERAVARIRDIVAEDPGVDKEFFAVRFTDFAESALTIMVIYFTNDISFIEHSETKQRINLAIMRALDEMGLSIAFPTRTVYFEGEVARGLSTRRGDPESPPPRDMSENRAR